MSWKEIKEGALKHWNPDAVNTAIRTSLREQSRVESICSNDLSKKHVFIYQNPASSKGAWDKAIVLLWEPTRKKFYGAAFNESVDFPGDFQDLEHHAQNLFFPAFLNYGVEPYSEEDNERYAHEYGC